MASTPLQVEDQTDEEFFDKLVDDDDGAGQSHSKPEEMARVLSNIGLGDVKDYGRASEEDCSKDNKYVESSEASKDGASFTEAHSEGLSEEGGGGAKGTNVKEAKWSDFSVDYQQFGQVGFESGSFIGSADGSFVIPPTGSEPRSSIIESTAKNLSSFTGSGEQQDPQLYSSVSEHSANLTEMQNWENLYPGWKYDPNAGQWYRLDGYNATENTESDDFSVTRESSHEGDEAKVQNAFDGSVTERADALYRQQTSHSVLETISDASIVSNSWNQVSKGSIEYPPNMVFDPQYPEWYYDTVTQQWYTLESYNHALHDASSSTQVQQSSNVNTSAGSTIADGYVSHGSDEQSEKYLVQEHSSQASHRSASASGFGQQSMWQEQNTQGHWNASGSVYNLRSMWQQLPSQESHREAFVNGDFAIYSTNQLTGGFRGSMVHAGSQPVKQVRSNSLEHTLEHISGNSNMHPFQDYVPLESTHHYNQPHMEQSLAARLSNSNYGTKRSINYTEQSFQVANPLQSQFSYIPNEGRSSAGRPPHTLVSFGFGGKIILMKDFSSLSTTFVSESHGTAGGVISIHSLMDVVMAKTNSFSGFSGGLFDYFHSLCQQSFPGPLVGGNAASKDLNKWMDDRIMSSESSSMDSESGELLRLLLSLLKILCQHYGKLRSPYGVDSSLEGSDGPESLVSKLFASAKRNDAPFGGFGSSKHCMKNLPSDGQMRATAIKFQTLLVSGKRMEALQCAQQGQLWGPALILAAQLGEQFYVDTVKQMAKQQFISGSPLRTLCLLIAGQPADVFSDDNSSSGLSSAISGPHQSSGVLPNSMLDDWKENLAIITSNRTKDDEVVIIHLGDCLWKVRGEVTAAHTCYLVSEANFESYSDSTRLCLIGADHWKNPRTYACPDAIQRTEIYEYSRVIGNSQFVLLPFQPYKLVYAYMLAEVGKISDSLRYCQASVKLLKNSGRSPEVEMWRTLFLSLEERLRTHQQGGYGTNLTPTKLVGKLFSSIDRSIHRMIGTPPLPPIPHNSGEVSTSQSTMAITSLMPSASVEDVSDWAGDGSSKAVHNRSISEPDFGRSPKQSSSKSTRSHGQGNTAVSVRPSHFGRFGFQLLQKTIGWMPWPRHDRQAKLGESNKFYYDEKLKRWVEEGTEPKGEETSLPPPPSGASFPNGISDYNINNTLMSTDLTTTDAGQETKLNASSEPGFGFPPMPPSQNQFSVRSRMGVRSRYVDTFNKGGGRSVTSSFQSPSTPSVKPFAVAKFFVPSAPTEDQTNDATRTSINENTITQEPSTSAGQESIFSPASTLSSSSLQRFPSMNNVVSPGSFPGENGSLSRTRAASWSGAYTDISNAKADAMEHSFVASGLASTFAHIRTSSSSSLQLHGGGSDDLHEVKL